MSTTLTDLDTAGRTMGDALASAPATGANGVPACVGRLWHSRRRWSWVVRYDAAARTFEDGSRFEPVAA